jgi:hypothetical protein
VFEKWHTVIAEEQLVWNDKDHMSSVISKHHNLINNSNSCSQQLKVTGKLPVSNQKMGIKQSAKNVISITNITAEKSDTSLNQSHYSSITAERNLVTDALHDFRAFSLKFSKNCTL